YCKMWAADLPSASPLQTRVPGADISPLRRLTGSGRDPALKFAPHDVIDHAHAGFAVIQAGNGGEILSAVMVKNLRILARDFLQRFQAIGSKARRDTCEVFYAACGQRLHRHIGVGLQPLGCAEARLEREHEFALVEPEPRAQQPHGLLTLAVIWIAFEQVVLRHAMKRREDHLGLEL